MKQVVVFADEEGDAMELIGRALVAEAVNDGRSPGPVTWRAEPLDPRSLFIVVTGETPTEGSPCAR